MKKTVPWRSTYSHGVRFCRIDSYLLGHLACWIRAVFLKLWHADQTCLADLPSNKRCCDSRSRALGGSHVARSTDRQNRPGTATLTECRRSRGSLHLDNLPGTQGAPTCKTCPGRTSGRHRSSSRPPALALLAHGRWVGGHPAPTFERPFRPTLGLDFPPRRTTPSC